MRLKDNRKEVEKMEEKTLKDIILDETEKNYAFVTVLKEKTEQMAKQSTLKLNDDELKLFYENYKKEAEIIKSKICF